ncbi:MAG: hypothetical protein WCA19_10045 [Candidatus Acidiferrales bacterium]
MSKKSDNQVLAVIQARKGGLSQMTYEYRCSETVLTRDALFETLVFLYQPTTEMERHFLESFAIASCDSWSDVHGDEACWLWLADRMKWNPKPKRLKTRDLGLLAEKIEKDIDTMPPLIAESERPPLGTPSQKKDGVVCVDTCTVGSLTCDALATTLSLVLQPEDAMEHRQINRFADAVCRVWTAMESNEECWQIYAGWLRTRVHLGKLPTCTDLGSLAEKMEEHLIVVQVLKVSKPLAKRSHDVTQTAA